MSLLPPEVHSALSQLLGALTAADNALRSQAEEQLNNDWAQNRPDILLMGLVEQIQGAEDTIVSICLVAWLLVCLCRIQRGAGHFASNPTGREAGALTLQEGCDGNGLCLCFSIF